MNHGIVIYGNSLESRIWEMAMIQGQFVAVYAEKQMRDSDLWQSTFVPPIGRRLLVDPLSVDYLPVDHPLYEWAAKHDPDYIEYARYEPQYDQQFFQMCQSINVSRPGAVIVPSITGDEEAMRLAQMLLSLSGPLNERYFDLHDRRKKSQLRLRDLFRPIRLRDNWTYLLGFVGKGDTNVFLTDDTIGEALIKEITGDKYGNVVIEKW
jgi:hypothetical protein